MERIRIIDLVRDSLCAAILYGAVPFQDVRQGMQRVSAFRSYMADLVQRVKARGPPADDDVSIAAHLLRVRVSLACGLA